MGKKTPKSATLKSRGSAMDLAANERWDGQSEASSSTTWTTCADNFECDKIDLFSAALDELFEKRGATREKALATLISFLREDVREEDCTKNETTIVGRCLNGVRKGGHAEAVLSAQLLAMHFISLPEPTESLLREVIPELQRAAASGRASEERVAAIEALAMCCFVAAEDDEVALEVMERMRAGWRAGDARVRAASLRAWSFLFTSLNATLTAPAVESVMADVAGLLHDGDVDVRGAAGEVAALMCDCCGLADILEEEEDGEEEEEEEEGDEEAAAAKAAAASGLDAVMGRMRDLATGHKADRQRRSRRDRAALRTSFRAVLAVVESGRAGVTKIKLQHGDVLVVDSVRGGVMLAAFRRALAGGFQVHMQRNGLLHDVFSFRPASTRPERLSAVEKRALRSPSSAAAKYRTHERKGDRAVKASRHALHAHDHAGDGHY